MSRKNNSLRRIIWTGSAAVLTCWIIYFFYMATTYPGEAIEIGIPIIAISLMFLVALLTPATEYM